MRRFAHALVVLFVVGVVTGVVTVGGFACENRPITHPDAAVDAPTPSVDATHAAVVASPSHRDGR